MSPEVSLTKSIDAAKQKVPLNICEIFHKNSEIRGKISKKDKIQAENPLLQAKFL